MGHVSRPDWTFQKAAYGGILNDLASHQIDQFLFFTGASTAEIVSAHVGNLYFQQYPELPDVFEATFCLDPQVSKGKKEAAVFQAPITPTLKDLSYFFHPILAR